MVEISWGKALGYGARYIVYIIVWAIIGAIIVVAGGLMIWGSVNVTYNSVTDQWEMTDLNIGGLIAGVVVIVIGEVVVILGAISSYFKLMSRLIAETIPGAQSHPPPP